MTKMLKSCAPIVRPLQRGCARARSMNSSARSTSWGLVSCCAVPLKPIDCPLADKGRGLGNYNVKMEKNARRHLAKLSDGDARKCLNALEIGVLTTPPKGNNSAIPFTLQVAEESIQQKAVVYDRAGDAHYDTISAFIKSMRASDEKGAMYWLAKMLHAGEDFRFIARRIVIFASEDIGLADPDALPLAIATQQAVEFVGLP